MGVTEQQTVVSRRILLDLDRCVGCKTCAAACYYGHRQMPAVEHGKLIAGALPLLCRHCEEPPCVDVCPSGALQQEESGSVKRSMLLCWGCSSCVLACPFGTLPTNLTKHVVGKCDLCADLTASGGEPRCVSACAAGALKFVEPEEPAAEGLMIIGGRAVGRNPFKRRF